MNLSDPFRLRRFLHDRKGISAVEFALIAPVMLLFYFGTVEVSMMLLADRKVTNAAGTLGDLTAREPSLTTADLDDIFEATRLILQPYDSADARMRITSIIPDPGNPSNTLVDWSYANSSHGDPGWTAHSDGSPITVPAGLVPDSGSVIYAEIEFDHEPALGYLIAASGTLRDDFYLRPRRVDVITLN